MQRKYNMALQHFYQAATSSSADGEKNLKARLKDLSGSDTDDNEEELFSTEKSKMEKFELMDKNGNDIHDNNNFFNFEKKMTVKRVKPVALCTWRGCATFWVWCLLFFIGVFSMTYFLKIAIGKIQPIGVRNKFDTVETVTHHGNKTDTSQKEVTGKTSNALESCSSFKVNKLWSVGVHKNARTKSSIRLMDLNNDGVDDIIFGYTTNLDSNETDVKKRQAICKKYSSNQYPCFGGLTALNGKTGKIMWEYKSLHGISEINCNGDLNQDGIPDCLGAGRFGEFEAISGHDGKALWSYSDVNHHGSSTNLFTPQLINDINNDGIMDILQVEGGDPFATPEGDNQKPGKILLFSGKEGTVLKSIPLPNNARSYLTPVIYRTKNGSEMVILGTGGGVTAGGLYVIQLSELLKGTIENALKIADNHNGYIKPPSLVDLNKDGVADVVCAGFGDVIQAFDGESLKMLWSYKIVGTKTYSIPGVGYYNEDDIVDLMIRFNKGPGYPVYYESEVLVLDGSTGKPLTSTHKTSVPVYSSPLTVSMEGTGNDLFLYWSSDCTNMEQKGGWYDFVKGTDRKLSAMADTCEVRYGQKTFSKLRVVNKKSGFPGKEIYSSDDVKEDLLKIWKTDEVGLQQIFQTGAVSVGRSLNSNLGNSFNIIFMTSQVLPSNMRSIRPEDQKCIDDFREKHGTGTIDRQSNEIDALFDDGDEAVNFCLKHRFNKTDNLQTALEKNLNHGHAMVHRIEVSCECDQGSHCARVLPQDEQGWSEYMGSLANGYFNERSKVRFTKNANS